MIAILRLALLGLFFFAQTGATSSNGLRATPTEEMELERLEEEQSSRRLPFLNLFNGLLGYEDCTGGDYSCDPNDPTKVALCIKLAFWTFNGCRDNDNLTRRLSLSTCGPCPEVTPTV